MSAIIPAAAQEAQAQQIQEVRTMKPPQKVPHADLIDDYDFRQWCDNNPKYQYCDIDKWRNAYIVYVQQARTAKEAAKMLNVCIDHVYCLVRQYEAAAKKYKAERNEH